MYFVQAVTFEGPESAVMNGYGVILINGNIQYNFKGTLRLLGGNQAQSISALNKTIAGHIIFDNPDGQWIAGPFKIDSLVQFESGSLIVVDDIETKFLDLSASSPSSLSLQQEIILTGSDFVHNGELIPVAQVDLTNTIYALASKGVFQFFGAESTCRILPAGQVMSLDVIEFFNDDGTAYIEVVGQGSFRTEMTRIAPNGIFIGNFDTNTLELGSGKTYTWEAGEIFDIGTIMSNGISCVELTNYKSSVDGQEAFLRISNPPTQVAGGTLIGVQDLHVIGGQVILENSFDLGNIVGWIIEERELFEEEVLPLCPGQTVYLKPDDPEEDWTYLWNDNSTLDSLNVQVPQEYYLVVSDPAGCMIRDTISFFLFDPGSFTIGNDTTICDGTIIEVSTDVVAQSYRWSNGDMDNSTSLSVGTHFVDVLLNGCQVRDSINIFAKALPALDLGADKTNCPGEGLSLEVNLNDVEFLWSDGSQNNILQTDEAGIYWLDISVDGCTKRDSIKLDYVDLPMISLGSDTVICTGDEVSYDFDDTSLSFLWNDMVMDARRSISTAGQYWVEASDGQCIITDTVVIGVSPRPDIDLGQDTMLCTGEMLTLEANPASDEVISWIDGSNQLKFDVMNSGVYWIDVDKEGCVVRDEIIITFNDAPNFDLGTDTLICEQLPLMLRPGISGATYLWQDGSTENRFETDLPGRYSVSVTKNGCTTTDEINVDTKVCAFYRAFWPKAFSPNGDGINDLYKPEFSPDIQIVSYSMLVYDRWGSLLFESEDPQNGWDGTFLQKHLNTGTYIYTSTIDYIDDRGPGNKRQRGEFFILR